MKYRILAIIVILLTFLCTTVNAADYEYSISPGENFLSVEYGDDFISVSQKLNMTVEELNAYFNQNGLIYLAISNDAKSQIKISAFTDNFSSAVNDISQLNEQALNEFILALNDDSQENVSTVSMNGRKYIRIKNVRKDSGGIYTVTQFVTICNNKTFYFSGYNEGDDTSAEISSAFQSFKLKAKDEPTPNYTNHTIFIIIGIIFFSIVAVLMIIGIFKSTQKFVSEENKYEG